MAQATPEAILQAVSRHAGPWVTSGRGKPFDCTAIGTSLYITPETGSPRTIPRSELAKFCAAFNRSGKRTVSYYQSISFNASYLLTIAHEIALESVDFALPEEIPGDDQQLPEGAIRQVIVNAYERNGAARQLCIEAHGTECVACGVSMEDLYGAEARGFIHVHHLTPVAEAGERLVDPVRDMRPVCPNCHAIIHLGGGCRSIEEVKAMLCRART
ncbi:HNH endonuclease [Billgrantia lactosivorans]|uniref:HNH endonuclease n=1 Tax=Billgrantia lactosivorans TaxID=2185141 RepID=UPI0013A6ADDC|nr:hypothetical protein [Halomonas lactosivorans]